jgi:PIN domain nuclease of toxin-antitoxin system
LDLLLDTQVLVWFGLDDRRLSAVFREKLLDADVRFLVSGVTAFELEDLRVRGRLGSVDSVGVLVAGLGAALLDFPAEAARIVPLLPDLHRDPVDRMLIAHAIHADLTLVTADATVRRYPVRTLW